MQRIVRLNDGTEYPCDSCGEADGRLWIQLHIGIAEACLVFIEPEKTKKITDTYAGDDGKLREVVWEGYTELFHISINDGVTMVGLRKGDAA